MSTSPIQDREIKFTVRLNKKEADTFEQNAATARMTRSDYMRLALTKGKIQVSTVPETNEAVAVYASRLIAELRRIGNNLNQLTRTMNTIAKSEGTRDSFPDTQVLKDLKLSLELGMKDLQRLHNDTTGNKSKKRTKAKS